MTTSEGAAPSGPLSTPPVSAAALRVIWEEAKFKPHALQRAVLLGRARNGVLSAGRRVGKSRTGGMKIVPEAFRARSELSKLEDLNIRREVWIIGPEYSDAEKEFRVIWDVLKGLGCEFDKPGSYNNPESGEMHLSLFNRRFVVAAKSAKYPGTLVGEGLSGAVFSEAAKLKPSVYNKFIRPTLADFNGWAFFSSTPEGRNWFYDFYEIGKNPDRQDWQSWRAPSWANPYVYPVGCDEGLLLRLREAARKGNLENALKGVKRLPHEMGLVPAGIDPEIFAMFLDMSSEMFSQEVVAEFTEFVGRVLKDFDTELHVLKGDKQVELQRGWKTYACADYGFTNPFVWLLIQVDPHDEHIHVIDEYYETGLTTEENARAIQERGLAPSDGDYRILEFFGDPAEPDRSKELMQRLFLRSAGGQSPKADRIEWLRRKMKPGLEHLPIGWGGLPRDEQPHFTVNARCINTIRECGIWKYPETAEKAALKGRNAPEEPEAKNNHCPEALGRFMTGHWGRPWADRLGSRIARARVGRERYQVG